MGTYRYDKKKGFARGSLGPHGILLTLERGVPPNNVRPICWGYLVTVVAGATTLGQDSTISAGDRFESKRESPFYGAVTRYLNRNRPVNTARKKGRRFYAKSKSCTTAQKEIIRVLGNLIDSSL